MNKEAGKYMTALSWSLTYKREQWVESSAILLLNHFDTAFVSYRRNGKRQCGNDPWQFLRASAFSLGRAGIIVFCLVRTLSSTAQFPWLLLCRILVLVFHCITAYKQPPPSLYRLHSVLFGKERIEGCLLVGAVALWQNTGIVSHRPWIGLLAASPAFSLSFHIMEW